MNEGPRYVTFRDYLRVVRERRVLVILVALLFGGTALGYSIRQTPIYQAEASLELFDPKVDSVITGGRSVGPEQTPEQRAAIGAQYVGRERVVERAREILRREDAPPGALSGPVAGGAEARTNLVVVTARSSTGEAAAARANAFAEAVRDVRRDEIRDEYENAADAQRAILRDLRGERGTEVFEALLRRDIAQFEQLAQTAQPVAIRRDATAPASPIRPKPIRTTLLGLLVGLTVGLVAAFIRDSLDRRFKSSREITEELHLPLLGFVPEDTLGRALAGKNGRKTLSDSELENFRILRTNIEFLDVDTPPKLILVTSPLPQEGKSTVSAALAAAYVASGKRTLLVECDLRRPTLADRLSVKEAPGLSDYLVGQAAPPEVLQTISVGGNANLQQGVARVPLVVIAAGSPAPQPAELLRSNRCRDFIEQVREVYDVVILDTCPLLSVVDTLELLPLSDAVVVCVRASQTTREQARAARSAIAHFPERPTGVVVTGIRPKDEAAYGGYYSYGYAYGART